MDEEYGSGTTATLEAPDGEGTGPGGPPPTGTETPDEPAPDRRWLWWVIGGLLFVAAVAALFFLRQPNTAVPQAVGLTQEAAEATITASGLTVGEVSEVETLSAHPGTVVEQSPEAGTDVDEGSAVDLSVAKLPVVTVPDVEGKPISDAEEALATEGLRPGTKTFALSDDVKAGLVISQDPAAGSEVGVATIVDLTVSQGVALQQIPNVIGLPASDAEAVLEADGFVVKTVKAESKTVPAGDVISQSPAAGVVTDPGSTVTITVSTGAPEEPAEQPPVTGSGEDTNQPPTTPEEPAKPNEPGKPVTSITEVPNVVGMRILEAARELRQAQLKVHFEFGPSEDAILKIIAQDPAAGSTADRGTVVNLTIGLPGFLFGDGEAPSVQPLPTPQPSPPATNGQTPDSGSSETTGQ